VTSDTHITVEFSDFLNICMTCQSKNCGTVISIALDKLQNAPEYCPTCKTFFGNHVQNQVNELLALCRAFAKTPLPIKIELKTPTV
jgi:hypothetical protein